MGQKPRCAVLDHPVLHQLDRKDLFQVQSCCHRRAFKPKYLDSCNWNLSLAMERLEFCHQWGWTFLSNPGTFVEYVDQMVDVERLDHISNPPKYVIVVLYPLRVLDSLLLQQPLMVSHLQLLSFVCPLVQLEDLQFLVHQVFEQNIEEKQYLVCNWIQHQAREQLKFCHYSKWIFLSYLGKVVKLLHHMVAQQHWDQRTVLTSKSKGWDRVGLHQLDQKVLFNSKHMICGNYTPFLDMQQLL